MATTYIPLYTTTLASAVSSVTISPISGAYTDLVLVASLTSAVDGAGLQFRFNGDAGSNYSNTFLEGSGSSATSNRQSNQTDIQLSFNVGNNSTNPSTSIISFMNYSNSTTNKTLLARWNSASGGTYPGTAATVGLWRNTAAITSIEVFMGSGNINAGSTFSLYGVAAASVGAKATGGDVIGNDGTYYYHVFNSSGTFTPLQSLTVDYLVVAGGGGGGVANFSGNATSGGGGAGGLRSTVTATGGGGTLETALALASGTGYTVTVGAGGAGSTAQDSDGTNGSNSVFSTITSLGGGYGSSRNAVGTNRNPSSGGSGGGGALNVNGAAGTANQGYAGGNPTDTNNSGAGGGGPGGAGGQSAGRWLARSP